MAKKNEINFIEREWESLTAKSSRVEFLKNRIDSCLKLFELQPLNEIQWSIYDDIDLIIRFATGSGILIELDDEYTQKFKKLIEWRRKKPSGFVVARSF